MEKLRFRCESGEPGGPQGESGKLKISEVEPLEGKRSFEVPSTALTTEAHRASWTVPSGTLPAGANNRNEYLRLCWYCKGDPSADVTLATWGNLKEGFYGELIHLKSGKLQLRRNGATVIGETAAKVSVGLRYLEMRLLFGTTAANGQIEGRLDGEAFAVNNATNLGAGLSVDQLRVGVCNSTGGPGELVQRFDAIAINDSQGEKDNSWVGALVPGGAPKAVTSPAAEAIGGAIATLPGTVNPRGLPTQYWFEYGETGVGGKEFKTPEAEVGDGEKDVPVKVNVTGLKPSTKHYFQLFARNALGEVLGEAVGFTTGPGPSGAPVAVTFASDHGGSDPLQEYGASGLFNGALARSRFGYGGGPGLLAKVTAPDGYARGIATAIQTGWQIGQEVRWGGAIKLPAGFYAAKQGQVDFLRWDNFEQDEVTTERSGIVMQTGDKKFRLVRIKEGEPDEQHTFNKEGEAVIGPEIAEGRWYWVEARQVLWHEDALAVNELWIDGVQIATSSDRNCARADLVVSRYRVGLAATNGFQTNPISVLVDRIRSGPMPLVGPLASVVRGRAGGVWGLAVRRARVGGEWREI